MYEALTEAYNEANAKANEQNKEKIFSYVLLNADFNETNKKGFCRDVQKRYDYIQDFNVISFTDIETNERYSVCQFYIELEAVTA